MIESNVYHVPVMVNEVLDHLITNPNGIYCDVTAGGGGHSEALLNRYKDINLFISDWDINAIKECTTRLTLFEKRINITYGSFKDLYIMLKKNNIQLVDGILADFGTSHHQIIHNDGFSFRHDTFLDMRMSKGYHTIKAYDLINSATEKQLVEIFFMYGQEKNSKKIAQLICEERKKRKIKTTLHLASLIENFYGLKFYTVHPATKIFQALRIAVNDEFTHITHLLNTAKKVLNPRGRIVCISFHSLEDTIVTNFAYNNSNDFTLLTKKPLRPTEEEIENNKASRSAMMRILEKK